MSATTQCVLLVASHGGHWVQMRRLAPAFDKQHCHYICTTAGVEAEVAPAPLAVVRDANLQNVPALFRLAWDMARAVVRIRPTVVVSTGAAPGFFALVFGKLLGARTIWIDSLANAERMSVSGRYVKPFADLWLTQWPDLETPKGPFYKGSVI